MALKAQAVEVSTPPEGSPHVASECTSPVVQTPTSMMESSGLETSQETACLDASASTSAAVSPTGTESESASPTSSDASNSGERSPARDSAAVLAPEGLTEGPNGENYGRTVVEGTTFPRFVLRSPHASMWPFLDADRALSSAAACAACGR